MASSSAARIKRRCGRISLLLDTPGLAREMSAHGRMKMARDFSPGARAQALAAAYRSALDVPAGRIAP
jgi:hypothetical protein